MWHVCMQPKGRNLRAPARYVCMRACMNVCMHHHSRRYIWIIGGTSGAQFTVSSESSAMSAMYVYIIFRADYCEVGQSWIHVQIWRPPNSSGSWNLTIIWLGKCFKSRVETSSGYEYEDETQDMLRVCSKIITQPGYVLFLLSNV